METVTWYYLIVDGVVVQKQPFFEVGFIEGPDDVVPGYLYVDGQFVAPPPDWLSINTIELERLIRLASAQVNAISARVTTLEFLIEGQDPEDPDYIEPTQAEIDELPAMRALLKAWNTYSVRLGRVKTQATWPSAPVWPVQPELYNSDTALSARPAASA